jgi:hypothetical protein
MVRARSSAGLSFILALGLLAGCAANSPRKPVANSVCLEVPLRTSGEIEHFRRQASRYLHDRGFRLADNACEVTVRYRPYDDVNAELILGHGGGYTGRLSQEGTLDVVHQGRAIVQDQYIGLRGGDSVPLLLDRLAWAMVEPVVLRFSPPAVPDRQAP